MPFDSLGHIKMSVSDIEKSKRFYKEYFTKLKYLLVKETDSSAGWVSPQGFGFWIEEAQKKEPAHIFGTPGLHHVCFMLESEKEVDEIYEWLKDRGTSITDPPAHYPEYTEKYYAVFFFDPDGIKLEVTYY